MLRHSETYGYYKPKCLTTTTTAEVTTTTTTAEVTTTTTTAEVTTTTTTSAGTTLKTGLASVWELNETEGSTINDSFSNKNGTVTNATINQTGKLDKCVSFDGTGDYIDFGDVHKVVANQDISLSAWVKVDTIDINRVIIGRYSDNTYGSYCIWTRYDLVSKITWCAASYLEDGTNHMVFDTASINTSNWYHVVGVWDRDGYLKLYVNGNSVGTPSDISGEHAANYNNGNKFTIGIAQNLSNYPFDGLIDQCAIWNKALTADEVATLYNSGNGLPYSQW